MKKWALAQVNLIYQSPMKTDPGIIGVKTLNLISIKGLVMKIKVCITNKDKNNLIQG